MHFLQGTDAAIRAALGRPLVPPGTEAAIKAALGRPLVPPGTDAAIKAALGRPLVPPGTDAAIKTALGRPLVPPGTDAVIRAALGRPLVPPGTEAAIKTALGRPLVPPGTDAVIRAALGRPLVPPGTDAAIKAALGRPLVPPGTDAAIKAALGRPLVPPGTDAAFRAMLRAYAQLVTVPTVMAETARQLRRRLRHTGRRAGWSSARLTRRSGARTHGMVHAGSRLTPRAASANLRHRRLAVASADRARCRAHGRGARMYPVLPPGGAFGVEQHARERMAELGITEAQVRETLERPDEVRPADDRPPTGPCNIYLRDMGMRRCKVYVRIGSDPMRVATVRWHGE